jgi:hypothetical protein
MYIVVELEKSEYPGLCKTLHTLKLKFVICVILLYSALNKNYLQ